MAQPRTISTTTERAEMVALRLPAAQLRALQRAAKRDKVSMSALVRRALIEHGIGA